MKGHTRRARRHGLITAGGLITALALSTGTAHADVSQDVDMRDHLSRIGIDVDQATAYQTGQAACRSLRADPTYHGVRSTLDTYERSFSPYQAGAILGIAAHVYCIDIWPLLDSWSKGEPEPQPAAYSI